MKYNILLILFLFLSHGAFAQWQQERLPKPFESQSDTSTILRESRIDYHLSVGTQVSISDSRASSLFWISPSVSYDLSNKTTLCMGFTYATDLFGSRSLSSNRNVDLSPRANRNTNAGSFYLRGEHRVNERLGFAATLFYENGMPTWCSYPYLSNEETIGISAEMHYKFTENSAMFLRISFTQSQYSVDDFLNTPSRSIRNGSRENGFKIGSPSLFK